MPQEEVVLSLISHTNVGKTALARTLLRKDVGEVADSAHVTTIPEAHTLIESSSGAVAKLWDTPGFGANLGKLAKRLRSSKNPIGWVLHQVWDRTQDKSLWCSQEAIRHVQKETDVVLYLIDGSQDAEQLPFVELELEVIAWIGKPTLVLLNQTGDAPPQETQKIEQTWRKKLGNLSHIVGVTTLDAFTRCWTQEHLLLEKATRILDGEKRKTARELTEALSERNLRPFRESCAVIAQFLIETASDQEQLKPQPLTQKLKNLITKNRNDAALKEVQTRMHERVAKRTAETVNHLIELQGLAGETASELAKASQENFQVKRELEEPLAAIIGGAASGLIGGIAADLVAHGLTFGTGALAGMLLGGATSYSLAKGYNLTQSGSNSVRWTFSQFSMQLQVMLLLYLAISHYGRGRGIWQDPTRTPQLWESTIRDLIAQSEKDWQRLWKKLDLSKNESAEKKPKLLGIVKSDVQSLLEEAFTRIYPESKSLFD